MKLTMDEKICISLERKIITIVELSRGLGLQIKI